MFHIGNRSVPRTEDGPADLPDDLPSWSLLVVVLDCSAVSGLLSLLALHLCFSDGVQEQFCHLSRLVAMSMAMKVERRSFLITIPPIIYSEKVPAVSSQQNIRLSIPSQTFSTIPKLSCLLFSLHQFLCLSSTNKTLSYLLTSLIRNGDGTPLDHSRLHPVQITYLQSIPRATTPQLHIFK